MRACRITKHGCSSIRDHFGSSVFTVRCFSKILEGFAVVLSHIAFPLTDGHLSCPELGHSCFSFSLLGFHDCFRKKSLWGFFFFFFLFAIGTLSLGENSVLQISAEAGMVN